MGVFLNIVKGKYLSVCFVIIFYICVVYDKTKKKKKKKKKKIN
jgi:prolipoprotein diacylglyceryltransferase